jgi:hypothetical protein
MIDPDELADVIVSTIDRRLAPVVAELRERLAGLDARGAPAELLETLALIRERVAALEARPGLPGPAGADGLGFDDLAVETDGAHTLTFALRRGDEERRFPIVVPWLVYRGVWAEGTAYVPGDVATWNGSAFVCRDATSSRPGDGGASWTLAVKRGK